MGANGLIHGGRFDTAEDAAKAHIEELRRLRLAEGEGDEDSGVEVEQEGCSSNGVSPNCVLEATELLSAGPALENATYSVDRQPPVGRSDLLKVPVCNALLVGSCNGCQQ